MTYDPQKHHRRSIRLKNYDYSQPGAYFVTICTEGRQCCFGQFIEGEMHLSDVGQNVQRVWSTMPERFSSESHLNLTRQYIIDNPIKWAEDELFM